MSGMGVAGLAIAGAGTYLNAKGNSKRMHQSLHAIGTAENAIGDYRRNTTRDIAGLEKFGVDEGNAVADQQKRTLAAFGGTMPGDAQFGAAQAARTSELNGAAAPAFAGATGKGSGYADRFTRALMADRIARSEAAVAPLGFSAAMGDQQLGEQQARDQLAATGMDQEQRLGNDQSLATTQNAVNTANNNTKLAKVMGALPGDLARAQRAGFWQRAGGGAMQEMGIGMAKSGFGGSSGMGEGGSGGGSSWWQKFTTPSGGNSAPTGDTPSYYGT